MSKAKEKRGEAIEMREDLQSTSTEVQKGALKKVIASMTVGRDVSNLFNDVVRLISSQYVEIKKLVYLYVVANAKVHQDRALQLASTFCNDFQHESPLVRGLAIRTFSAINVEKMANFVAAPLRDALKDQDPYVRKCAATAVAKMFAVNPQRAEDGGFLQNLQELLCDVNPTVVASAVCALNELRASTDIDRDMLDLNNRAGSLAVNNLLNAVGDTSGCNEWGQVYILDGLATYEAENADKAELICERILPRLQHANAAVVLSTVRIIMMFIERWCGHGTTNESVVRTYLQKVAPPLVSLVSGGTDFEIRYVALRNITIILQRFPELLTSQVKVFFVKYNDPIYIKLEKLEILLILVNHINVREILSEFNEYAMEVDIEFVRKAVRAIGITAIKIESAAEECVGVLTQLIKQKVNYVVQEAIIVTRDIFRKYPGRYESIIGLLCDSLESLEDPGAKAAMIWIIGQYSDKIDNADELLEEFMESFDENENIEVRLAILTATVKLFLRRHDDTQELLQRVLKAASESETPDLRDRGYIYWRLLSADPQGAKQVVLGMKESISADDGMRMDPKLVSELVDHIGTVASCYHKPPEAFMASGTYHAMRRKREEEDYYDEDVGEEDIEREEGGDLPQFEQQVYANPSTAEYHDVGAADTAPPQAHADPLAGVGGGTPSPPPPEQSNEPFQLVINPAQSAGIEMQARFITHGASLYLQLQITNNTGQPASDFQMQLNTNVWGIGLGELLQMQGALENGGVHRQQVLMSLQGQRKKHEGISEVSLQFALRSSVNTAYGTMKFNVALFFDNAAVALAKSRWLELWRVFEREVVFMVDRVAAPEADSVSARRFVESKLTNHGLHLIAKRSADGMHNVYWSLRTLNAVDVLIEVHQTDANPSQCKVSVRMSDEVYFPPVCEWVSEVLGQA
eukprot:Hpha_TRINITY_DN16382_c1_g5::TRINITY_DN16382_c1_g5_i2::g.62615::m.62615/K11825/AP2B1; AP-2 complex subunit beta-1